MFRDSKGFWGASCRRSCAVCKRYDRRPCGAGRVSVRDDDVLIGAVCSSASRSCGAFAIGLSAYDQRHTSQLWQLHKEKRALRKSHLDHWEATVPRTGTGRPVDAILSPAVAYAACPHGCNT